QRATALAIARFIKILRPAARIVAGGYDPSLAPEAYEQSCDIDFIVRGEGERTLSELLRAIERDSPRRRPGAPVAEATLTEIDGLSYRTPAGFVHNTARPVAALAAKDALRLPNRAARVLGGYTMLGRRVDVVETSRGCTFDCSFCSIIE